MHERTQSEYHLHLFPTEKASECSRRVVTYELVSVGSSCVTDLNDIEMHLAKCCVS